MEPLSHPTDKVPLWFEQKATVNLLERQEAAAFAGSFLEHNVLLNPNSVPNVQKLTSIICTIGPASSDPETLVKMIEAGMRIARMNFSHGTYEYHTQTIINCRKAAKMHSEKIGYAMPLAIALDTKGPEIRTGLLEGGKDVELKVGAKLTFTFDEAFKETSTAEKVYCDYANMGIALKKGDRIFIDDGLMAAVVEEISENEVITTVEAGGMLGGKKGINLPGVHTDLPGISEKDAKDLVWGAERGVDIVFASFIRDGKTVREMRELMGEKGLGIQIIAKIECVEGMDNIDEIIEASDGIMVARGDLGIEIPAWKVFVAQKILGAKCNIAGKPYICATQMMESMTYCPFPTRAECNDVATALQDGADCVMLSGETAKGLYPVQCVEMMASICRESEAAVWSKHHFTELEDLEEPPLDPAHDIAIAIVRASLQCCACCIVALTESGRSVRLLSRYRPRCPIICVSRNSKSARTNNLFQGVISLFYTEPHLDDYEEDVQARFSYATKFGEKQGFIRVGEPIIQMHGWTRKSGAINTFRLVFAE